VRAWGEPTFRAKNKMHVAPKDLHFVARLDDGD
jgi:hypothetical protein